MQNKKIKKVDLINQLMDSLGERQWDMISKLLGRELSGTHSSRVNFLSKVFKKTIAVSSRKGKGRALQQWTCEQISKLTGRPWSNEDDSEIKSRPMGQKGPDVVLSPRVRKIFPFTPECKNQESWSIVPYIAQAKANCYPDTDWLLIITKNGHEEIAILDAKAFFSILKGKK